MADDVDTDESAERLIVMTNGDQTMTTIESGRAFFEELGWEEAKDEDE